MAINIKTLKEIPNPDDYDGCYGVVRRLSELYAQSFDVIKSTVDGRDLDALLFMPALRSTKRKERIGNSHLPQQAKREMEAVIDEVDDKARNHYYAHSKTSNADGDWGLFRYNSGKSMPMADEKTRKAAARDFIQMVKELLESDGTAASKFAIVDLFAKRNYQGLQAGMVSQFLHCLFPFDFPILNGPGVAVYTELGDEFGFQLKSPDRLSTYADNCAIIKKFRDEKLNVRNYRAIDIMNEKPTLADVIRQFMEKNTVWSEWLDGYNKYIPRYIDEAKTGKDWSEWDDDTFREFMSVDNHVASIQQGNFSGADKKKLEEHWNELAPHLKTIAERQDPDDEPDFKEYNIIRETIKKYTKREMRAATNRLVAALQPQYLCTVVASDSLWKLYSYIEKYTCEEQEPYSGDWFHDSYNMLMLFLDAQRGKSVYEIATLPWQIKEYFDELEKENRDDMNERDKCEKFLRANYNMILTGAPGTGKTYLARQIAAKMLGYGDDVGKLKDDRRFAFTQFHPSYDYADFVEGLRPSMSEGKEFEYVQGIFKRFCAYAQQDLERPYVFVIDEINRGDISKILGELFFAIDPGYRKPCDRIPVKTQYQNMIAAGDVFADGFFVPENVYIIGTMNDIDRSVESLDFAFRRRFPSVKVRVEDTMDAICRQISNSEVREEAKRRLQKLNSEISHDDSLGGDYCLGASYLLKLNGIEGGDDRYQDLWDYYLEPVISEYLRGFETGERSEKMARFADAFGVNYGNDE